MEIAALFSEFQDKFNLKRNIYVRVFPDKHPSCHGIKPQIYFFHKSTTHVHISFTLWNISAKLVSKVYSSTSKFGQPYYNSNSHFPRIQKYFEFIQVSEKYSVDHIFRSHSTRACADSSFLLSKMIKNTDWKILCHKSMRKMLLWLWIRSGYQ
ncbi:hypothetical protein MXB_2679 [Myxobolus squamalis]|nr:hypothetical protein MXB_2679 [Myxobolus squamalis]